MTVGQNWQNSDVPSFYVVKEANRQKLFEILDRKERSKALVWDQDLMKPFFLIANFKDMQDHGVTQMFPLQYGPAPLSPVEHVIYLCAPSLKKMEIVIDNLRNIRKDDQRQYHLIFLPRTSVFCQNKLKEADVLDKFTTVAELPIYAYAWDSDVLSMQNEAIFSDYTISEDSHGLFDVASCLLQLEIIFGQFSQCYFKGDMAEKVYQLIKKRRSETRDQIDIDRSMSIDRVVLIDRAVDLVTPLVSQLTYEGLIDEIFGIKCTQCKLPKENFTAKNDQDSSTQPSTSADSETMNLVLNSNDELFAELRNLNFSAVAPALSRNIKNISELQEQRHAATTVRECKEFVKRMPKLLAAKYSASVHMNVAELIKEATTDDAFLDKVCCEQEILNSVDVDRIIPFIEDSVAKGESMFSVLRLICLQSLITDGLKPKIFDQYRKEFLHSFGFDRLALLCNLQKAGFLKSAPQQKSGKSADTPYSAIRKTFRLIVEDVNELTPNDLSYVYSGYAPLSARLCQYLIRPGWKTILDNLKRIPGAIGLDENMKQKKNVQKVDEKKITLIVFIGGVTFAEISALRYLSETDENHSFLIMTTSIINGKSILNCFN